MDIKEMLEAFQRQDAEIEERTVMGLSYFRLQREERWKEFAELEEKFRAMKFPPEKLSPASGKGLIETLACTICLRHPLQQKAKDCLIRHEVYHLGKILDAMKPAPYWLLREAETTFSAFKPYVESEEADEEVKTLYAEGRELLDRLNADFDTRAVNTLRVSIDLVGVIESNDAKRYALVLEAVEALQPTLRTPMGKETFQKVYEVFATGLGKASGAEQ